MTDREKQKLTGIKRLEKKRGRIWGFLRREEEGVPPMKSSDMIYRLRHLLMSSVKTMTSFIRTQLGEETLSEMLDYQASEFASHGMKLYWGADQIAENIIRQNFQPLGIETEYIGNREEASMTVNSCPLPNRFLQNPELLTILCRVMLPKVSEEMGFAWTYGLTEDKPPKCFFTLKSRE